MKGPLNHLVSASFMFAFGLQGLLLAFYRMRQLPPGTLAKTVPEKNGAIMATLARLAIASTGIGIAYDCLAHSHPTLAHISLYLSFTFVGIVAWLESRCRLPPDSHRVALSLAFLLGYIMWSGHSHYEDQWKNDIHHIYLAQINLASAIVYAYGVQNPSSMTAYVGGSTMVLLQGFWLFTIGIINKIGGIPPMQIGSLLSLEVLVLCLSIVLATACVWETDKSADAENRTEKTELINKGEYERLEVAEG